MAVPSKTRTHLSALNTSWHNKSISSLSAASDTGTFHSAHANVEMSPLTQAPTPPAHNRAPTPLSKLSQNATAQYEAPAQKMSRSDSGYSDTLATHSPITTTSTRTSTSSRQRSPPRRRSTQATRPLTKRATTKTTTTTISSITLTQTATTSSSSSTNIPAGRTSTSSRRPSLQMRHTLPTATYPGAPPRTSTSTRPQTPYQFFQFPVLETSPPPPIDPSPPTPIPSPPPATIQYWTSDSTRRLEYAAIDAASRGVKGFFIKLVPDCILPVDSRRMKFHNDDEDGASEGGSVRRYRLVLEEEKGCSSSTTTDTRTKTKCGGEPKPGFLRRWTSFGRRVGTTN